MSNQTVVPPVLRVTNFAFRGSPSDIAVSIGHTRFAMSEDAECNTHMEPTIEWTATLSMSPTAFQTMYTLMGLQLMSYREKFGPITEDKTFAEQVTQEEQSEQRVLS